MQVIAVPRILGLILLLIFSIDHLVAHQSYSTTILLHTTVDEPSNRGNLPGLLTRRAKLSPIKWKSKHRYIATRESITSDPAVGNRERNFYLSPKSKVQSLKLSQVCRIPACRVARYGSPTRESDTDRVKNRQRARLKPTREEHYDCNLWSNSVRANKAQYSDGE